MAKGNMEFENKEDAISFIIDTMMAMDISIADLQNIGVL